MIKEEMKKNADFLIKTLSGKKIPGSQTINIRYRTLVNFAKVFGITEPKYVGSEEKEIIACHAFANHYLIKALYPLLIGIKLKQDGKQRNLILNFGKILHAGQKYNWEGCVDVKSGDKLTATGKWGKIWLVEKNMILFGELFITFKNQNDERICKATVSAALLPGGY